MCVNVACSIKCFLVNLNSESPPSLFFYCLAFYLWCLPGCLQCERCCVPITCSPPEPLHFALRRLCSLPRPLSTRYLVRLSVTCCALERTRGRPPHTHEAGQHLPTSHNQRTILRV